MFKNSRSSTILLAFLLSVDLVLISFHFLHRLTYNGILPPSIFSNTIFSMSIEAQLPDIFQFLKQLGIVLLLLYVSRKEHVYRIWAAIFAYLLLDDLFLIHESVGFALEAYAPQIGSIARSEVAQIGYLFLLSIVMFGIALLMIWRTRGKVRLVSIYLTFLLAVAAFFGVFVDLIQSVVMDIFGISGIVKIVEDGGEMIIFSFILWYVYKLAFETIPIIHFNHIFKFKLVSDFFETTDV